MFSLLMISAMFMVASCGSKSNSGEAEPTAQVQDEVKKVEFTDPAIEFNKGLDLTSYFSAESVTQPTRIEEYGHQKISFTVKLKLIKPIENVEKNHVFFTAKLCDENESPLAQTEWNREDLSKFTNAEVGKVFSFSFMTSNSYGDNMFEKDMNEVIGKIRKITILQSAD